MRRGLSGRAALLWCLNGCFLIFFLFPFYWLATTALKTQNEIDAYPIQWLPGGLYLGNFRAVFTYLHFQTYLFNSCLVAGLTTAISVSLSVCAAYALARLPLPARRTLLVLIVTMISVFGVALVPSLYLLLRDVGWLNTRKALIGPYVATSLPFAIWILTNAFRDIALELTEQAEVDGCTPLQVLWRVVLPLALPALLTAGVVTFLGAWNELLFALMFILDTHSNIETMPVALLNAGGPWGIVSAASLIAAAPTVAIVVLLQSRIVRGFTAGAVKG